MLRDKPRALRDQVYATLNEADGDDGRDTWPLLDASGYLIHPGVALGRSRERCEPLYIREMLWRALTGEKSGE